MAGFTRFGAEVGNLLSRTGGVIHTSLERRGRSRSGRSKKGKIGLEAPKDAGGIEVGVF